MQRSSQNIYREINIKLREARMLSARFIIALMSMFEKQFPSRTGSVYIKSVIGSLFIPAGFIAPAALHPAGIMKNRPRRLARISCDTVPVDTQALFFYT